MADKTVPTLEEDRVLAPTGRIRLEDGSVQKVGMQEAYAEIAKRQESGFYQRVYYESFDTGDAPAEDKPAEEPKPEVGEAEKKAKESTPNDTEQGFERGTVSAYRLHQHRKPKPGAKPVQPGADK